MLMQILYSYLYLYLYLTIKNFEFQIIESNLFFRVKTFLQGILVLVILIEIIFFLKNFNIVFIILFYVNFINVFLLKVRLEILRLYFVIFNYRNFGTKFLYNRFLIKFFGYNYFVQFFYFENFLRKSFIILVPFLLYISNSLVFDLVIIFILVNFRFTSFDFVLNKALFNIFDDQNIILTKEGNTILSNYTIFLIQDIMKYKKNRRFSIMFLWGRSFFFFDNNYNDIMLREFNL